MSLRDAPSNQTSSDAGQRAEWRRNQAVVTGAAFIGSTAFTLVMPFLPLYIQELGVADVHQAALWAGLSLGITPAITALVSPFWGRVADRYGRKLLLERSIVAFVIVMALMACATQAWQIFALRAALGFVAGYGALTVAMAAENAPPEHMSPAIGTVQTAQRLGPALGPVIGGGLAAAAGIRRSFLVTACFYVVALLLIGLLYREKQDTKEAGDSARKRQATFADVLRFPNFPVLVAGVFVLQFVERSVGPILPLVVAELGAPRDGVALASGLIFSVIAIMAAAGAQLAGRLMQRGTAKRVVLAGTWTTVVAVIVAAAAGHVTILGAALGLGGLAVGVAMTACYAVVGSTTPAGMHATTFGLLASGSLVGLAIGPTASGLVASLGFRVVFCLDALMLAVFASSVARFMSEKTSWPG
ncbi:MAG: MFS transporter [Vicinamibacterales bacterium]